MRSLKRQIETLPESPARCWGEDGRDPRFRRLCAAEESGQVEVLDEAICQIDLDGGLPVEQTIDPSHRGVDKREQECLVQATQEGPRLAREPLRRQGQSAHLSSEVESSKRGRSNGHGLRLSHGPRLFWSHLTPFSARTSFLRFTRRTISPG